MRGISVSAQPPGPGAAGPSGMKAMAKYAATTTPNSIDNERMPPMRSAINPPTGRKPEPKATIRETSKPRRNARDMILHGKIQRQRVGEANETAEGDEVEEAEPAAVGIAQQ